MARAASAWGRKVGPYKHPASMPEEARAFMFEPARSCSPVLGWDPDVWFADGKVEQAKMLCRRCPVMRACDKWATETGERWGVWGGKNRNTRTKPWTDPLDGS